MRFWWTTKKGPIRTEDLSRCPPFFTPDMQWAYVDEVDLAAKMHEAMQVDAQLIGKATAVAKDYSPEAVGKIMDQRILALMGQVGAAGAD